MNALSISLASNVSGLKTKRKGCKPHKSDRLQD